MMRPRTDLIMLLTRWGIELLSVAMFRGDGESVSDFDVDATEVGTLVSEVSSSDACSNSISMVDSAYTNTVWDETPYDFELRLIHDAKMYPIRINKTYTIAALKSEIMALLRTKTSTFPKDVPPQLLGLDHQTSEYTVVHSALFSLDEEVASVATLRIYDGAKLHVSILNEDQYFKLQEEKNRNNPLNNVYKSLSTIVLSPIYVLGYATEATANCLCRKESRNAMFGRRIK